MDEKKITPLFSIDDANRPDFFPIWPWFLSSSALILIWPFFLFNDFQFFVTLNLVTMRLPYISATLPDIPSNEAAQRPGNVYRKQALALSYLFLEKEIVLHFLVVRGIGYEWDTYHGEFEPFWQNVEEKWEFSHFDVEMSRHGSYNK